ncbi:MAG: hypothetical protein RI907_2213 [Pseudomonadota bacterium]
MTMANRTRQHGFTLIEVLVSLLILSVLAATCWKGVDAMSSAREVVLSNMKTTLRLSAVMTQIEADLGQAVKLDVVDALVVDSRHVRLTRRGQGGVQVVVWLLKDGRLFRWASPVTTNVGELQKYSLASFQLNGVEPGTLMALEGVSAMQAFCYVNGNVANCQSSRSAAATGGASGTTTAVPGGSGPPLPEAMRVQLTLAEGAGRQGTVTREIPVAMK